MNPGQVILVIIFWVVVIFLGMKYSKWKKSKTAERNRTKTYSREYYKEQDLTGHTWLFTTSADPRRVFDSIESEISRFQAEIGGLHQFRIAERTEKKMVVTYGVKAIPGFTAAIVFGGNQPAAAYQIINWLQSGGVSRMTDQMETLLSVVKEAVLVADENMRVEKRVH